MLPPLDPKVLEQNSSFAIVYKDLCTRKLDSDGCSKESKRGRGGVVGEEVHRNFTSALTSRHKTHLLLSTLSTLSTANPHSSPSGPLPPDLHAAIELVTAQLSGHIPDPEDREMTAGDVDYFLQNLDLVCDAIGSMLQGVAEKLCKIVDPVSPPTTADLPTHAHHLLAQSTCDLPSSLATARSQLTHQVTTLLDLHALIQTTTIRHLEQTMHGSLSRSSRAQADLLREKGRLLGLQAKIHTLTPAHQPPTEFLAALKSFKAQQLVAKNALLDREALATETLQLYEEQKGIRDAATRARYLRAEMERVKEEASRLEKGGE